MSKNPYKPQVWVLPEDDANRQIAEAFKLEPTVKPRNIEVLNPAGGWAAVRDSFEREYNTVLQNHPLCWMVLLVDFDGRGENRLNEVLSGVEDTLKHRVFVLGTHSEPERLKAALGKTYEQIGKALGKECSDVQRPNTRPVGARSLGAQPRRARPNDAPRQADSFRLTKRPNKALVLTAPAARQHSANSLVPAGFVPGCPTAQVPSRFPRDAVAKLGF